MLLTACCVVSAVTSPSYAFPGNTFAVNGSLLKSVLSELRGKSFTIRHPMDTFFFATAMSICKNKLQVRVGAGESSNDFQHSSDVY